MTKTRKSSKKKENRNIRISPFLKAIGTYSMVTPALNLPSAYLSAKGHPRATTSYLSTLALAGGLLSAAEAYKHDGPIKAYRYHKNKRAKRKNKG